MNALKRIRPLPLFAVSDWVIIGLWGGSVVLVKISGIPVWPLWAVCILGCCAVAAGRYLCAHTGSRKEGVRRSALLAAIVTPSVLVIGWSAAYCPPLLVFLMLALGGVVQLDYWFALLILLFAVLPWLVGTGLIYWIWSVWIRARTPAGEA
jgi:4-hydroxybenzoate polyprenyltransferase